MPLFPGRPVVRPESEQAGGRAFIEGFDSPRGFVGKTGHDVEQVRTQPDPVKIRVFQQPDVQPVPVLLFRVRIRVPSWKTTAPWYTMSMNTVICRLNTSDTSRADRASPSCARNRGDKVFSGWIQVFAAFISGTPLHVFDWSTFIILIRAGRPDTVPVNRKWVRPGFPRVSGRPAKSGDLPGQPAFPPA